jgi:hypothetical protein
MERDRFSSAGACIRSIYKDIQPFLGQAGDPNILPDADLVYNQAVFNHGGIFQDHCSKGSLGEFSGRVLRSTPMGLFFRSEHRPFQFFLLSCGSDRKIKKGRKYPPGKLNVLLVFVIPVIVVLN